MSTNPIINLESRPKIHHIEVVPTELLQALAAEAPKENRRGGATVNSHYHSTADDRQTALDALAVLDPSMPYDDWRKAGMALHSVDASLLGEWDDWSKGSDKYIPGKCAEKWNEFKSGGGVGTGTLCHMANATGKSWKPPRPAAKAATSPPAAVQQLEAGTLTEADASGGDTPPTHIIEADDDPHRLAQDYMVRHATTLSGEPTLRAWRGEFWRWNGTAYEPVSESEMRGELTRSVKQEFDRIAATKLAAWEQNPDKKGEPPTANKVTRSLIANVINSLESMTCIPNRINQPCWLIDNPPFDASEVLVTKSGLLHLPSLVTGQPSLLPPTPTFFASTSLGCEFDPNATCPTLLAFLLSVWPDDQDSIDLLAEWIGYLLLPDVSHHKILLIVGPMRSGKGTIGRILKLLLGQNSVANPTLGSLAGPFGLWPLLNKSAAVISDARLSNKVDGVAILERLLSISGGDPQNIDRKCLPTVTAVMMAVRFTILTNELMRLTDESGAITSRFIVLKMVRTFLGKEDKGLDAKLANELPGILNWAINGWQRLRERGRFSQPESGGELLQELRDLTSPVGMFVRQTCITGPEWSVGVEDIYGAWCEWCKEHGREHPGTQQSFGRDLRAAVSGLSVGQQGSGINRIRRYDGIAFRPEDTHRHASLSIGREKEQREWNT